MSRPDPVLEVNDIVTAYGPVQVVDGVSLDIRQGEMLALVGESGSGKTTTARTIARLLEPASGSIHFRGEDITHTRGRQLRALRRHIQLVYQDQYEALNPRFTVRSILEEPLRVQGLARRGSRAEQLTDALERVGLHPADRFLGRHPHELSGGQRQRVAIAAALMTKPQLLIADEPVSMLDVSVRAGVLELLRALERQEQMAVLMITHDLATAAHVADRIAVMYLGRVIEEGPARQVIESPTHPYTKALLSIVPERVGERQEFEPLAGEPPDPAAPPSGCRFRTRCPVAMDRCAGTDPRLRTIDPAGGSHRAACLLVDAPDQPASSPPVAPPAEQAS